MDPKDSSLSLSLLISFRLPRVNWLSRFPTGHSFSMIHPPLIFRLSALSLAPVFYRSLPA